MTFVQRPEKEADIRTSRDTTRDIISPEPQEVQQPLTKTTQSGFHIPKGGKFQLLRSPSFNAIVVFRDQGKSLSLHLFVSIAPDRLSVGTDWIK